MKNTLLLFLLIIMAVSLQGQRLVQIQEPYIDGSVIQFSYGNDFVYQTDKYLTHSLNFAYYKNVLKLPKVHSYLPLFRSAYKSYQGFAVTQEIFTPKNKFPDGEITFGDRPFAAVLYGSYIVFSSNVNRKYTFWTEGNLGIIGPYAITKPAAEFVYEITNSKKPPGWKHQIRTDAIININLGFEKGIINIDQILNINGYTNLRAGILYNDFTPGIRVQTGYLSIPYFANPFFINNTDKKKNFSLYLFGKAENQFVGYNATLQGGLFNLKNDYHLEGTQIKKSILKYNYGLAFQRRRMQLEFSSENMGAEFKGGSRHRWGKFKFSYSL